MSESTTTVTTEEVLEVLRQICPETVSPYRVAKLLEAAGGPAIPPQMVYTYVKKGYIKASGHNNTDKIFVEKAEVLRWTEQYLGKKNS